MDIGTTLLEYGADTNAVTRQGIGPIHLAAQEGSVDLVSLLLAKNASVNMCNKVNAVTKLQFKVCIYITSLVLSTTQSYTHIHTALSLIIHTLEAPAIELLTFWLVDDPTFLLSHSHPCVNVFTDTDCTQC